MRRATVTALSALLALVATAAMAIDPSPGASGVSDGARIFTPETLTEADRTLRDIEKDTRWQTRIETVKSLEGKTPKDYATDAAKKSGVHGLFILIAPAEKKIQIEPSDSARSRFGPGMQKLIIDGFVEATKQADGHARFLAADAKEARGLQTNGYDLGLRRVVAGVRRAALGYGVFDHAGLFNDDTDRMADHTLNSIRNSRQVVIETVKSLGGKSINDVATANARALGIRGVYLLIAKNDHKVFLEPSESAQSDFPPARRKAIVDAVVKWFKEHPDNQTHDGLLIDLVALLGKDLGLSHDSLAYVDRSFVETCDDSPGKDTAAEELASIRKEQAEAKTRASTSAASSQPLVPPTQPSASGPAPRPVPSSETETTTKAAASGGSIAPLLLGGLAVVVVLWLLARVFRRPATAAQPSFGGSAAPAMPPVPRPGPSPAPGPQPGYGPGPGPAPAPGYGGYGPPPQAAGSGGGGFLSSALGGMGGAIVGNMIYDKFGHPHPAPPDVEPRHVHGAEAFPPDGGHRFDPDAPESAGPAATPSPETYDPNAGAGGDWGTPDPNSSQSPDTDTPDDAINQDWTDQASSPDAAQDSTGDWGAPDQPDQPDDSGGDESSDAGTGGDWGGDPGSDDGAASGGSDDENQGGSW